MDTGAEYVLRQQIIEQLAEQVAKKGALTRDELTAFKVGADSHKLIDRNKGIWNPKDLLATLSIMSKPDSPYTDEQVGDSLLAYDYRDGNPRGDNVKLRRALELQLPIILLRWIKDGVYIPVAPVYVIRDDFERKRFILALDESLREVADPLHLKPIERSYAQRVTKQRLHQPEFRGRVLLAYGYRCAACGLAYPSLLDGAHIIADSDDDGSADVDNGLSLCKIHHAAYDANLLGISPDHVIHIGPNLMHDPTDSPMLRHGLQDLDGKRITLPRLRADYPAEDRLERRFGEFQAATGA
ncbi:HNH endonuclease [Nocardia sp. NPDC052566]|uniref:HNH endonuclease n=1 Tax=Nocardia sp. NPDC052566 TaxID=3364330 RepID=UPI0037C80841